MFLEKTLQKIQQQINDLAPTLELFVEESVQPSVNDCEQLQALLVKLQENLAIYKFHCQERELSPSFGLHAKVSEKSEEQIVTEQTEMPVQNSFNPVSDSEKNDNPVRNTPLTYAPLSFGINDKFRFVNELFRQNMAEYGIVMEQLNALQSWTESEIYLNSLKMIYGWKDNSDVVNLFYTQVKKRFM